MITARAVAGMCLLTVLSSATLSQGEGALQSSYDYESVMGEWHEERMLQTTYGDYTWTSSKCYLKKSDGNLQLVSNASDKD